MRVLRHLGWVLPLALGAVLLGERVFCPLWGSYDANTALYSIAARNCVRYGLWATRGGQVINGGEITPDRFRFYAHHPPGISLTIAAAFAVRGPHTWNARLVAVAFTLGAAAFLYLVARKLGGPWAGFCAAAIFVMQPMVAFYGAMPDHEAPAAFFALLLTWCYLRWRGEQRRAPLVAMAVTAFIGVWFAWVVAALSPLLVGHHVLTARRGWRRLLVPLGATALGFLSVLGHIALLEGGLGELWGALVHRLGSQAGDRTVTGAFGLAEFLARMGAYAWTCFTVAALLPALLWAVGAGRRRSDALLVAALLLWALANIVGFKQGAYVHIYYQFYLAIPLALAAGLGAGTLGRRALGKWWPAVALAVLAIVAAEGRVKLRPIRRAVIPGYSAQMWAAEAVRQRTQPGDRVLMVWGMRASFRQLIWYSDRDITVVPTDREADQCLAQEPFDARIRYHGGSLGCTVERLTPRGGARPRAPGR